MQESDRRTNIISLESGVVWAHARVKPQGRIEFPFGACRIDVYTDHMFLRIEVENPDELSLAEEVVTKHLVQIANRDEPTVEWSRLAQSPVHLPAEQL